MFLLEWLTWCWLYLQHTFVMMYWITIPGLLAAAFLSLRYRAPLLGAVLKRQGGFRASVSAIGFGLLDGDAGRVAHLRTMEDLTASGVSLSVALAYLLAGQAFPLPVIGLFTVLVGLEFGLGLLLGGLAMILLAALGLPLLGPNPPKQGEPAHASPATPSAATGEWSWAMRHGGRPWSAPSWPLSWRLWFLCFPWETSWSHPASGRHGHSRIPAS